MVASNRIHTTVLNVALAGADLTENWQNAVLLLHQHLKDAGFTVQASSNSVTADGNDNIATIADLVSDSPGSAHSWIHYRAPTAAGVWDLILDCNDGAATPQEVDWFGATSYNSDGTTTNRPTAVANEWSRANIDLIPTVVPATPMKVHRGRCNDGEFWFGISINGSQDCESGIWMPIFVNGDLGVSDPYPYAWYNQVSASGAFSMGFVTNATNWRTHHNDNSDVSSVVVETLAASLSSLTNGLLNSNGKAPGLPIDFATNSATQARVLGRSQDIKAAPANIQQGLVEDGDTDSIRRVSIDDLWFVVQSAQLPITL